LRIDMNPNRFFSEGVRSLMIGVLAVAIVPGDTLTSAPLLQSAPSPSSDQVPKIPSDQLDSLVAPIALYPDPLLAQTLAASTYPLELVQLQQWLEKNKNLKDAALTEALQKQDWDPGVQSMAPFPEAMKLLTSDIKWTTELGNAFLAQQSDVMQ